MALALVTRVRGDKPTLEAIDIPQPRITSDQLLVRVASAAQNPTDVQCLDNNVFGEGAVLGCDFAGIAEKVGGNVTAVKVGDRVAGLIWGGEVPGVGGYSQYTVADEKISFKVPQTISLNDAATVPLAATTAWLALYSSRCLNISRTENAKLPVLIWGGSSSVGLYAIQLARIYSIPVVTTCSPKHFDLCKRLGAKYALDYHDVDVAKNIKTAVPEVGYIFDCIGSENSSELAAKAVGSNEATLCTVRPGKLHTENVPSHIKVTDVLVWTAFLKDHQYKEFVYPASVEDNDLSAELYQKIPSWLEDGTLRTNSSKVLRGGLNAVPEGFQLHRENKISGFKLVYEL